LLRKSNLKGLSVPESAERLIVKLFADDTTVYLNRGDSFENLEAVLEKWCKAARAKFNIKKTEVIPAGNDEYRQSVITTRRLGTNGAIIPPNIHIAADGEAVRILGAFIGNRVDENASWLQITKNIDMKFKQWERLSPTIIGRKHIVQMFAGGMTQFRTKAQGMPKKVEKQIKSEIGKYLAKGSSHPAISLDQM
ncbi:hypothetical protein FISHEDRAFT_29539, partial [Fistulina hepatica ATCC 64428]